MDRVVFDKVQNVLWKLPKHIFLKLQLWAQQVELHGIRTVRRIPGYHDEPLKGELAGLRSVRLSRSYRLIYSEHNDGRITIIELEKVSKHDY